VANPLAYDDTVTITAVKKIIVQVPGLMPENLAFKIAAGVP